MSPKGKQGKQARKSQRKKAQERAELLQLGETSSNNLEDDTTVGLMDSNKKKRPREAENENGPVAETEVRTEPLHKKNLTSVSLQQSFGHESENVESSSQDQMDSQDINTSTQNGFLQGGDSTEGGKDNEVNIPSIPPPPPMGLEQWAQIMSRFDKFEKTIQTTIKEEIKINTVGLQKQVKSLNTKIKTVEGYISNISEIEKISHKVAKLDNFQEIIAAEVQKQVSMKVGSLEKDLETSQVEIVKLKEAKPNPPPQDPSPSGSVSRQEFMKEQCYNRKRNLMLMGVGESEEGEDERSKIGDLLQSRQGISKPKIEMAVRMGTTVGKFPRPILISFKHMEQRLQVWYKKGDLNKDQTQKLWLQEDLPKQL